MSGYDYDLFVIGAGSGGVRAARMAAQAGARVAIAEESRYGGTCVIRGCVPKKLMVYASSFAEHFEDARGFGWQVDSPRFDWDALKRARDKEVDRLEAIYLDNALKGNGVTTHRQRAAIADEHSVELMDGTRISAETLLIATGGRPQLLNCEGASLSIVSDEVFHLPEFPRRLLVIGAGYVAVEFACIFNGLGAQVTLANRSPMIVKTFDVDIRDTLQEEMAKKGIDFLLGTVPKAITDAGGGAKRVIFDNGETREADVVLMAAGRRPNLNGLGLETVGIEPNEMGAIPVDELSRTNVPSIYAVGDVTDRAALTPVAIREGAAFAETVFKNNPTKPDHDLIPTAVFTQPEIGTIGMTEDEARAGA